MPRTHFMGCFSLILIASLQAASAASTDSPGVTVSLNGSALLHRAAVQYPSAARQKGVQGTVVVEATLDDKANVIDARVLSGPAELRRTSLESVLQWHFTQDAANSTRQVAIQFDLPASPKRAAPPDFFPSLVVLSRGPTGQLGKRISEIEILGLPAEARNQLLARVPLHPGDVVSEESADAAGKAVREFDEHLNLGFVGVSSSETKLEIVAPGYDRPLSPQPTPSGRVQVSSDVMQARLRSAPPPAYPESARQARLQGVVKLRAVIGKDGAVQNLGVLSGHPLLVPAALAAVKLWRYDPLAVNGAPEEVECEIDVNFTLPPQ